MTTNRDGEELALAIERGEELSEIERMRVVLRMRTAQLGRLTARIDAAVTAVQRGADALELTVILRGLGSES